MNNKEILETANASITAGDYDKFLTYCTEDTKWIFVGDRTLSGKESVRRYMESAYATPPKFTIETLIAEGDFVTAIGEISLLDKSGKWINYQYCDVWRFKDKKMAELKAFVIEAV